MRTLTSAGTVSPLSTLTALSTAIAPHLVRKLRDAWPPWSPAGDRLPRVFDGIEAEDA